MTVDFKLDDAELQTALKLLSGLVKDQLITVKEAAKRAGLTEEEFAKRTGLKRSIKHKRVFYRGNRDIIDCTRC